MQKMRLPEKMTEVVRSGSAAILPGPGWLPDSETQQQTTALDSSPGKGSDFERQQSIVLPVHVATRVPGRI